MKFHIVIVASVALIAAAFGRKFDRCSLAKAMDRLGVPRSEMPKWTCIAQHESSYRTNVIGPTNPNGSQDYGIFQINNLYWCKPDNGKFSYNLCSINCKALLTDNIKDSVKCARQIKSQKGWKSWSVWKYCKGHLPSIDNCF